MDDPGHPAKVRAGWMTEEDRPPPCFPLCSLRATQPAFFTPKTQQSPFPLRTDAPPPRFIQAKSSLKASVDQANVAHRWRARLDMDNILRTPPGPWYEVRSSSRRCLNFSP